MADGEGNGPLLKMEPTKQGTSDKEVRLKNLKEVNKRIHEKGKV